MIHRENIKKIANALTISENDIQYEDQYKSYTIDEKEEIIINDKFSDIQIDIPIKFYKCHIKFNSNFFKKDINISLEFYKCKFINTNTILCNFNKKIYFKECEFLISEDKLKDINEICISSKFLHGVDFSDTKFNHSINFANSAFYNNTNFRNTKFESSANFKYSKFNGTIDFSNTIFKDNVYFNNSIFQDSADFHECEFEKTANFYGVKFDKAPNFSQAQFKGSLNAVNANLNFDFENLENKIYEEYKTYNRIASENNENLGYIKRFFKYLISFFTKASKDTEKYQKPIEHFANDFRDSFRIFKSTLIKDNNLLDASNFHKCELYCKEIELKESRHKRGINTNNNEDTRKNIKPFKELIDFLLLRFYRNLCDHHTDFLKCFNNLVLLVALYAVLLWIGNFDLMQGKEPIISDILHQLGDKAITLKKDIKKYDWLVFLIFLALAVSCLYYLYKTIYLEHKLYIKNIKLILSFTKNSLKNICFFMLISVAIIFFYAAIIATLITLLNLNDMHYWQSYLNFISFVLFFVIYFSLISLDCVFVRFLLVIAAYIITSISIGKNIAILNPLIGKLLNTSIEIKDPIFQSITIAYTISTLLVLFSLQKTARKNSIVPN